jgi:hypothetical protein
MTRTNAKKIKIIESYTQKDTLYKQIIKDDSKL